MSVVTVRIAGVSPSAELARALETPTFERAQGMADEASMEAASRSLPDLACGIRREANISR